MDLHGIMSVLGVSFVPVTGTLLALWLSARRRAMQAEAIVHQLTVAPALRGESSEGTSLRFGQALDAIAVEVERISEGQRFTTRLLSERRDLPPPAHPPRVNTPH